MELECICDVALQDAIAGLRDVLFNKQPMRVPHAEMTDAITVKDSAKNRLKPGAYVRVNTAGVYKGDLAQILNMEAGGVCLIKVVPRIDLAAMAKRCALPEYLQGAYRYMYSRADCMCAFPAARL